MGSIRRAADMKWLVLSAALIAGCATPPESGGQCEACSADADCVFGFHCALDGAVKCCERRAVCSYEADPACDDGNLCTTDWCGADGLCRHDSPASTCAVGDECLDCTTVDPNGCQVGVCNPGVGCSVDFKPAGTLCQESRCEGTMFVPRAVCNQGKCVASANDEECTLSGDPCLVGTCKPEAGCGRYTSTTPVCGLDSQWGVVELGYEPCAVGEASTLVFRARVLDLSTDPGAGVLYDEDGNPQRSFSDVSVQNRAADGLIRATYDGEIHDGSVSLDAGVMALQPRTRNGLSIGVRLGNGHAKDALAGRWVTWLVTQNDFATNYERVHTVVGETILTPSTDDTGACVYSAGWSSGAAFGDNEPSKPPEGGVAAFAADYNAFTAPKNCIAVRSDGSIVADARLVNGGGISLTGWLSEDGQTAVMTVARLSDTAGAIVMRRAEAAAVQPTLAGTYSVHAMGSFDHWNGMVDITRGSGSGKWREHSLCRSCSDDRILSYPLALRPAPSGYFAVEPGSPVAPTQWQGVSSGPSGEADIAWFWSGNTVTEGQVVPRSPGFGILLRHPPGTQWDEVPFDTDPEVFCPP